MSVVIPCLILSTIISFSTAIMFAEREPIISVILFIISISCVCYAVYVNDETIKNRTVYVSI